MSVDAGVLRADGGPGRERPVDRHSFGKVGSPDQ